MLARFHSAVCILQILLSAQFMSSASKNLYFSPILCNKQL